jgi:hypothetical protein
MNSQSWKYPLVARASAVHDVRVHKDEHACEEPSTSSHPPTFEIESQVDIRSPIVMQVLSDEREGMPDQ